MTFITPLFRTLRPLARCLQPLRAATFFIAAYALSTGANAQFGFNNPGQTGPSSASERVQTEQVRAELVVHAPDGVEAGKTLWLGLQLQHQPHWHTYWKNPGDSGLSTQLAWTLPKGVTAGDIAWPTPQKIAIGNLANFGYEGTVLLPVPLTIAPSFAPSPLARDLEIGLTASWLVCRQECIPQEGRFVLRIALKGSSGLHGAAFEAARAASPLPHAGAAQVQLAPEGLTLSVSGLPSAWQGKALNVFPETVEIIETAAAPTAQDAVASDAVPRKGTQAWKEGVWSARIPLSAQRIDSPSVLPVVLGWGAQSLRTTATVRGTWPAAPPLGSAVAVPVQDSRTNLPSTGTGTDLAGASRAVGMGAFAWALAAALLGGLILNLMPCVFPVLAIKVLGFASHARHSRASHRLQGLAYTAGVVLSFMALGGLMLGLRAGGEQLGWGFQLQSPAVIAALAVLFTLLGLNLAGLLEVGHLLPSRLASLQLRHPAVDAFLSGMLAVAVASPCTAPFMGASLGYAITLPSAQALGIFAALGLGLALPFLVASWVPAVGRWLPRPGAWMDALRRFMAFLMWATVVWLVWVLGHLSGVDGAASLLALLLSLSLVVWSFSLRGRSRWTFAIISIAVCALLTGAIGQNVLKIEEIPGGPAAQASAPGNGASATQSDWQAWAPGRVDTELAAGNPVFVDFTAAWCITCQYNKQTTLGKAEVLADFAAKNVTLLRADWTRRDPAITQALEQLGRSGVPVYVLYQTGRAPVVLSEILSPQEVRAALARL
ncbi:MAG: protein-disulfide reductase [Burkholderiales bacterium RIFCSPLOWO2_12_FULL_61_40]|nr:MAG: protein-disulfide reductase [Burkholderiales bacterium RIFCSPLOWO2_12_FULL_61_40]